MKIQVVLLFQYFILMKSLKLSAFSTEHSPSRNSAHITLSWAELISQLLTTTSYNKVKLSIEDHQTSVSSGIVAPTVSPNFSINCDRDIVKNRDL